MKSRIVLLLALLPLSGQAEVYKCRLPDGRTEYSNTGCANSSTLSVRRDETVSPESRAEAERDVERMRDYVREREAANRPPTPAAGTSAGGGATTAPPPAPSAAAVEDCLRDLERQAMESGQRADREAACRTTGRAQPNDDGLPVYVGGSAVGRCIRNVERLHLSPHERTRRIEQCQGIYRPPAPPPPRPRPDSEPPAGKTVVLPEPAHPLCPPGQKNCRR